MYQLTDATVIGLKCQQRKDGTRINWCRNYDLYLLLDCIPVPHHSHIIIIIVNAGNNRS